MGGEVMLTVPVIVLFAFIITPGVSGCAGIVTNEVHIDCSEDTKQSSNKAMHPTAPMTEYFKEHEVTETESRIALQQLDLDRINRVPAWCDECGIDKIHFCRSPAFINDHCCCEHRHAKEKLPWIPHTCYLGKERCQPHTSSCSRYREIRECCCDRILAAQYLAKFSAGSPTCSRLHMAGWTISLLLTAISAIGRLS
ncbi:uncharacterized protein LOC134205240 [Armigeres subalbatus]|uniref:uncharacterized protein LOC134205240 n=1 Tax=Armigeres subalbatus TaxID=124917 RepID=UPI002ED4C611